MLVISLFITLVLPFTGALEIRHVNSDGAILMESGPNYAMSSSNLMQNGWKTVTINGNNIAMVSNNCQTTMKNSQTLSEAEQSLVKSEKSRLGDKQPWGFNPKKYFSTLYNSGRIESQVAINMNNRNLESDKGAKISKNDETNFTFAKSGLPMNLARVFLNNDVATFVYLDGQIQMKPINCLQSAEQQLLQQIRLEVQKTEEQERKRTQERVGPMIGQFAGYNGRINIAY